MDQVWPWITTLSSSSSSSSASSTEDSSPSPPTSLLLAAHANQSILLQANIVEDFIRFSISVLGFEPSKSTLWTSNSYPLSPSSTHYHLLTQLVQEIISLSPSYSILLPPSSHDQDILLDVGPTADAINGAGRDSAPALLALALLCRLFWLCAVDGPAEAGFLFFRSAVGPVAIAAALDCHPALRGLLAALGPDWEERFMRSLGYVLAKWCLLRDLQVVAAAGPAAAPPSGCCPCYMADSHGLWILKGYAPISAMTRVNSAPAPEHFDVRDSVLRYALAHQQLEAVIQLEYRVSMRDPRYIGVSIHIDNIRLHVARLGFGKNQEEEGNTNFNNMQGERHFPSRIRIWAGPELGSAYATGLSLGRSTGNPERELETTQTVKGNLGAASKFPGVKARAKSSVRSRGRNWRWEQEAEGNAGVFEGVLCDGATGAEVAAGGGGGGMRRRYAGVGRAFSKGGGLVVAGDEMGEAVSWRVAREMEGKVLKWRVGGRVWVSYYPNEVKSGYFETRCVEWREEVDLHLVACA